MFRHSIAVEPVFAVEHPEFCPMKTGIGQAKLVPDIRANSFLRPSNCLAPTPSLWRDPSAELAPDAVRDGGRREQNSTDTGYAGDW